MRVLGVACGTTEEFNDNALPEFYGHDASAAVVDDDRCLIAIEEERLSRIKHSNFFPTRAVRRCLQDWRVASKAIDAVAIPFSEAYADNYVSKKLMEDRQWTTKGGRAWMASLFGDCLGKDLSDKVYFCQSHHIAHAWNVFFPSKFDKSLICVFDGIGEDGAGGHASGLIALGHDSQIEVLESLSLGQSLGLFYLQMIGALGYEIFDEYKVMALASYGDSSTYNGLLSSMYELLPNGSYRLADANQRMSLLRQAGILVRARRRGEPLAAWHKDFAAALQQGLQNIILHVVKYWSRHTNARNLCVSGGVALNSVANGKVMQAGMVESARFDFAGHDGGNALGAGWACIAQKSRRSAKRQQITPYLGTECPDGATIQHSLERWAPFVSWESANDETLAVELAKGNVVGLFRGRAELGPRALGNRSIVADPRYAHLRDRINSNIKKRESFRPLAPAVLAETARDYFEIPQGETTYAHMNVVVSVTPAKRSVLGAVTHADGSARIQTVDRRENPSFWSLIRAFGKRTGVDVLLNTSFNRAGEPIVDSVEDAIACFLNTDLDLLVLGNWLVRRRPEAVFEDAIRGFRLGLLPYKKLVRRATDYGAFGAPYRYAIESTATRYFDNSRIDIPKNVFELLMKTDGMTSINELCSSLRIGPQVWTEAALVIKELWRCRAIVLLPGAVD